MPIAVGRSGALFAATTVFDRNLQLCFHKPMAKGEFKKAIRVRCHARLVV